MRRPRVGSGWLENVRFALGAMREQKLRSFLTVLGVMAGVATVIMMVSFVVGFDRQVTAAFTAFGTHLVQFQKFEPRFGHDEIPDEHRKLFDEKISVIDDGTIDGKFASAWFDDEGVPHRRNALVENGTPRGFIYDLKTAAQSGVESTGNGSRQLFYPPEPSFTNIVIQPGQTPLKDMLASMDEGIIVEDLLGIGEGNIISGAFSNPIALAFKVEKDEIVGRVKDRSIAGNSYDLLKNVVAVSQEAHWIYSTFYAPYVLIPEMNVAGRVSGQGAAEFRQ